MAALDLLFDGKSFTVPKQNLMELLKQHQELSAAQSYAVQSAVPVAVFETFVAFLITQRALLITKGNAVSLGLLAQEFCLSDVAAQCATLVVEIQQAIEDQKREFSIIRLSVRKRQTQGTKFMVGRHAPSSSICRSANWTQNGYFG
jgi:hypothetical protein